nr:hypothetical protein [Tanacetum cinerariifolium]
MLLVRLLIQSLVWLSKLTSLLCGYYSQESYQCALCQDELIKPTSRDYYCWLKTYCCWYKLKLLDNAADLRLRLLEQSAAIDYKMKKYH